MLLAPLRHTVGSYCSRNRLASSETSSREEAPRYDAQDDGVEGTARLSEGPD